MNIAQRPSPNYNYRPPGLKLDTIILHDTGSKTLESAASWCQNPASKVSYHYIVDLGGAVVQLVDEARRAWHAGKAALPGEKESDVNGRSVGVAMVNDGAAPYPAAQVEACAELCADIMLRHRMKGLYSHAIVALPEGRKSDPHALFPWKHFQGRVLERLDAGGMQLHGTWFRELPEADPPTLQRGSEGPEVAELQHQLDALGYLDTSAGEFSLGFFGGKTEAALRRFQQEHPHLVVDGIRGPKTFEAIRAELALLEDAGKGGQQG